MADSNEVSVGFRPWEPNADAALDVVWDRYAYAPLSADDASALGAVDGEAFDAAVDRVLGDGPATVAFARGEAGVVAAELLRPGHTSRQAFIRDAVNALHDRWLDDVDEVVKPFDLLVGV